MILQNMLIMIYTFQVPATLVEKRAQVVEQFKQLQSETDTVLKILTEPEVQFWCFEHQNLTMIFS